MEPYVFAGVRDVAEKQGVAEDLVPKVVSLKPLVTLSVLAGAFAEHQGAGPDVHQEILATAKAEIGLLEAALTTAKAVVQTIEIACAKPEPDQPSVPPPIDAVAEPATEFQTTPRRQRVVPSQS